MAMKLNNKLKNKDFLKQYEYTFFLDLLYFYQDFFSNYHKNRVDPA